MNERYKAFGVCSCVMLLMEVKIKGFLKESKV